MKALVTSTIIVACFSSLAKASPVARQLVDASRSFVANPELDQTVSILPFDESKADQVLSGLASPSQQEGKMVSFGPIELDRVADPAAATGSIFSSLYTPTTTTTSAGVKKSLELPPLPSGFVMVQTTMPPSPAPTAAATAKGTSSTSFKGKKEQQVQDEDEDENDAHPTTTLQADDFSSLASDFVMVQTTMPPYPTPIPSADVSSEEGKRGEEEEEEEEEGEEDAPAATDGTALAKPLGDNPAVPPYLTGTLKDNAEVKDRKEEADTETGVSTAAPPSGCGDSAHRTLPVGPLARPNGLPLIPPRGPGSFLPTHRPPFRFDADSNIRGRRFPGPH